MAIFNIVIGIWSAYLLKTAEQDEPVWILGILWVSAIINLAVGFASIGLTVLQASIN